MKTAVSAEFLAHLAQEVTTIAYCWVITRRDAVTFRFTDHDCDLVVSTKTYLASSAMGGTDVKQNRSLAVDNMEAMAFLDSASITDADLRAGLFDGATVDLFMVNWADLTMGVLWVLRGWQFGSVEIRDATCTVELRGIGQTLETNICDLYSETCRADFGDAQCGIDLEGSGMMQGGSVDSVSLTSPRHRFVASSGLDMTAGQLVGGVLTWTSTGTSNFGLSVEIGEADPLTDTITLFGPMPYDISPGDDFLIVRGCDKTFTTCEGVFANALNFRGEPWVPISGLSIRMVRNRPAK